MFKFNNTHIFTGYLKQLLSSFNLPTCRVYTDEFSNYFAKHGVEDPRVIESFDVLSLSYIDAGGNTITKKRMPARINYLKNDSIYCYFWNGDLNTTRKNCIWKQTSPAFYESAKNTHGLTRTLNSYGSVYDTATHEYLGDYLRFLRDYYQVNLMSLYNCFNNSICNNINKRFSSSVDASWGVFDSQDKKYRIYALPVKLFANYTIAIDCPQSIEMFCGFYKTSLDSSAIAENVMSRTYKKVTRPFFKQPFLYNALDVKFWNTKLESEIIYEEEGQSYPSLLDGVTATRHDIANREQDLKLFIKVPTSCTSSIVVLEGDYRNFNDCLYKQVKYKDDNTVDNKDIINFYFPANEPAQVQQEDANIKKDTWEYKQNHLAQSFSKEALDQKAFAPISKLQLLAFNTGESYPFADRLIEYLSNSAITPIDEISDNIKRAQSVMEQNKHYFKIKGIWEPKMQKIIYDYIMHVGPIEVIDGKLVDKHLGYLPKLGHSNRSFLYDVLGYVDKNAEKWYASWKKQNDVAVVKDSIQNIDIYDGLFNI
jgi:hypothetical protein